jgi:hypothetical protein
MLRKPVFYVMLLAILIVTACSPGIVTTPEPQLPTEPLTAKPENGKATLVGKVISIIDGMPLQNTVVRLAEVYRQGDEGAFVLDGAYSPGDITDEQGRFSIENVDVKEYVIVVGDVYDKYQIIAGPDDKAKIFQAIQDEVLDVGELEVDLTK